MSTRTAPIALRSAPSPRLRPANRANPAATPSAGELRRVVYGEPTEPTMRIVGSAPTPNAARRAPAASTADRGRRATRPVPAAVYRRRRIAAGLALVVIGALVWTAVALFMGVGDRAVGADLDHVPQPVIHIVQPGDTLWSIAEGLDPDGDVRRTVDRLAEANGGSSLSVGQRLVVG